LFERTSRSGEFSWKLKGESAESGREKGNEWACSSENPVRKDGDISELFETNHLEGKGTWTKKITHFGGNLRKWTLLEMEGRRVTEARVSGGW